MMETAAASGEPAMLATVYELAGIADLLTGRPVSAGENYERALAFFAEASARDLRAIRGHSVDIYTLRGLAFVYTLLGSLDRGLEAADRCLRRAEELDNPFYVCEALWAKFSVLFKVQEHEHLLEVSRRLMSIAEAEGWRSQAAMGQAYVGMALGGLGRFSEAIDHIERARDVFESLGDTVGLHQVRQSPLAAFLARAGRTEEALRLARQVASTSSGHHQERPLVLLRLAEVLRLTGDLANAELVRCSEARHLESIDLARTMGLKLHELEASTSLAKLWRDTGRRSEAARLLSAITDAFEEGHGTGVLQRAKRVLESLEA